MEIRITLPFDEKQALALRMGDRVLISGIIYTARDAAHKNMCELLDRGEQLPVDLRDQILYYAGPAPAKPGTVIGAAGPTSSYRMDAYAPRLIAEQGLRGMIGKGKRSPEVLEAIKAHQAVYFAAIGGAGALLADRIKEAEVIAWPELGTEAVYRLRVGDFPAVVAVDCAGRNLYESGPAEYLASLAD